MNHPNTTWAGIFTILGAVATMAIAFFTGHLDSAVITTGLAGVGAGFGLIKAADGNKV